MAERFRIAETLICSFNIKEQGIIEPDDRYPLRLCVIDEEKEIAIDVEHNLQYNYINTGSSLYLQQKAIQFIKDDKRAAIFGCITLKSDIADKKILRRAEQIIQDLKKGKKFIDGNSVMSNEEYLEAITKDKTEQKVRKIGKKK